MLCQVYSRIRTVVKSGVLCITNQDSLEKGRVIPSVGHDIFLAPFVNLLIFMVIKKECMFLYTIFLVFCII